MLKNTPRRYGAITKFFHWTIALLVLTLLCVGLYMVHFAPKDAGAFKLFALHKSTGIVVLALALTRVTWHLYSPPADFLPSIKPWEKTLARLTHYTLYFCMLAMPLTGWFFSTVKRGGVPFFGLFTLPQPFNQADASNKSLAEFAETAHDYMGFALIAIIGLHVAGALKHFVIDKDITLQRMLPFGTAKRDLGEKQ